MGLTYADIRLESILKNRAMEVKALVDSGAVVMIIPEHIALQLGFDGAGVQSIAGRWIDTDFPIARRGIE